MTGRSGLQNVSGTLKLVWSVNEVSPQTEKIKRRLQLSRLAFSRAKQRGQPPFIHSSIEQRPPCLLGRTFWSIYSHGSGNSARNWALW